MKSTFLALFVLAFLSQTTLAADAVDNNLDLMKDIVGTFQVLSFNGQNGSGGKIRIQANVDGVGWVSDQMVPSVDPATPSKALAVITPADATTVTRTGNVIVQQGTIATTRRSSVRYEIFDGYITVESDVCWPSGACEVLSQVLTTGKAPGTSVDVAGFMNAHAGSFDVLKVNGVAPEKPETLDVDVSDPTEGAVYAQYCDPITHVCDLGYNGFPYDRTTIYDNSTSATDLFFDIFVGAGPTAKHFSWGQKAGVITFRNYQYLPQNATSTIVLEHQASVTPPDEAPVPETEPSPVPETEPEPILE